MSEKQRILEQPNQWLHSYFYWLSDINYMGIILDFD